jgi:hypothetical protein
VGGLRAWVVRAPTGLGWAGIRVRRVWSTPPVPRWLVVRRCCLRGRLRVWRGRARWDHRMPRWRVQGRIRGRRGRELPRGLGAGLPRQRLRRVSRIPRRPKPGRAGNLVVRASVHQSLGAWSPRSHRRGQIGLRTVRGILRRATSSPMRFAHRLTCRRRRGTARIAGPRCPTHRIRQAGARIRRPRPARTAAITAPPTVMMTASPVAMRAVITSVVTVSGRLRMSGSGRRIRCRAPTARSRRLMGGCLKWVRVVGMFLVMSRGAMIRRFRRIGLPRRMRCRRSSGRGVGGVLMCGRWIRRWPMSSRRARRAGSRRIGV